MRDLKSAQMLLDTHPDGILMPPGRQLPESELDPIIAWINQGAQDN